MKEDLLHYVWRTKQFARDSLRTTQGDRLSIKDFGKYNRSDGGPDFKECRVEIADMVWAGSVEMHLSASDWYRHGHDTDPAYDNVILHVVIDEDRPVSIHRRRVPCLEMRNLISKRLLKNYHRLSHLSPWVPCQQHIKDVPDLHKRMWLGRMVVERLEQRVAQFSAMILKAHVSWDRLLLVMLARGFGFKANPEPMQRLLMGIPSDILEEMSGDQTEIEALLFGRGGFLNRLLIDEYGVSLIERFSRIRGSDRIKPMEIKAWQRGGMRPANLPTLRIAQFAAILSQRPDLLEGVLNAVSLKDFAGLFRVKVSEYWTCHSDFDRPSRSLSGNVGGASLNSLLVNAILPFLFLYAKHHDNRMLIDRSLQFMSELKPENNYFTRNWIQVGMLAENVGHSQALLHLKRHYCDNFRCLECSIGNHILTKIG